VHDHSFDPLGVGRLCEDEVFRSLYIHICIHPERIEQMTHVYIYMHAYLYLCVDMYEQICIYLYDNVLSVNDFNSILISVRITHIMRSVDISLVGQ